MFKSRKIVFFGSPHPSVEILNSLVENGHEVIGVITGKDKRRSRGNTLYPTPVKKAAQELGIDVFEPNNKIEIEEVVKKLILIKKAEVGIVVAYGKILSVDVLNSFKYGCINIHYSLLPKWRGAAPVERAILEHDEKTGISIMSMDEGLDTGSIYSISEIEINSSTTSEDLYIQMAQKAKLLLNDVLIDIDKIDPYEQKGESTYANKLSKIDFEINASSTLEEISVKVRAGSLLKGAYVNSSIGKFRILQVGSIENNKSDVNELILTRNGMLINGDGSLEILKVQSENKPAMNITDWVNGIDKSSFDIKIL